MTAKGPPGSGRPLAKVRHGLQVRRADHGKTNGPSLRAGAEDGESLRATPVVPGGCRVERRSTVQISPAMPPAGLNARGGPGLRASRR